VELLPAVTMKNTVFGGCDAATQLGACLFKFRDFTLKNDSTSFLFDSYKEHFNECQYDTKTLVSSTGCYNHLASLIGCTFPPTLCFDREYTC
jgi:hypothetical protein